MNVGGETADEVKHARLEIVAGRRMGQVIDLGGGDHVIGSDEAATIPCSDPQVEWSHARIYLNREKFWIEDLNSRGGVFVNDRRVSREVLSSGDLIGIGAARLRFCVNGNGRPPSAPAPDGSVAEFVAQVVADMRGTGAPGMPGDTQPVIPAAAPEMRPEDWHTDIIPGLAETARGLSPTAALDGALDAMAAAQVAAPAPEPDQRPGSPIEDLASQPATTEDLVAAVRALEARNRELSGRVESAEGELRKKREGLSLATESFVEQLERAKERIASFAKRHTETEALVRSREEELDKLKADHGTLELVSAARTRDLLERLESVRRDFDDLARLAAQKGQNLARLIAEAKVAEKPVSRDVLAAAAALVAPSGPGVSGEQSAAIRRAAGSPRAAAQAPAAAVAEPVPAPALPTPVPVRLEGPLGSFFRSQTLRYILFFLVIAGAAFCFIFLLKHMKPQRKPFEPSRISGVPRVGSPAGSSAAQPKPKPPGAAPVQPAAPPQRPPQPTPAPTASAPPQRRPDEDIFAALRQAHTIRDDKAIHDAEQALIARGKGIAEQVRDAYEKEHQFNVKVSLQYIMLSIDGKDSAAELVEQMRNSKDPGEKMRLAFMLGKLNKASDLPFLEQAAQNEQDPMIKKYILRALGNIEGTQGMQVLTSVAQSNPDRNLRIEAIRAIEEKGSPESASFLAELAKNEQDPSIKSFAIRALANTANRDCMSYFTQVLEQDERTNNRAEAAKYMGRVGELGDRQVLESIYQKERVYYIRQKIRQAIDAISRRNGVDTPPVPVEPTPPAADGQ